MKQRLARELVKIYVDKSITRKMMEKTFGISTFRRKDVTREKTVEKTTHKLPINYPETTHEVFAMVVASPTSSGRAGMVQLRAPPAIT